MRQVTVEIVLNKIRSFNFNFQLQFVLIAWNFIMYVVVYISFIDNYRAIISIRVSSSYFSTQLFFFFLAIRGTVFLCALFVWILYIFFPLDQKTLKLLYSYILFFRTYCTSALLFQKWNPKNEKMEAVGACGVWWFHLMRKRKIISVSWKIQV